MSRFGSVPAGREPSARAAERVRFGAAVALLIGCIGLLTLWREVATLNDRFRSDAQVMASHVSQRLAEGTTMVSALHGFYQSAGEMPADRFPQLAERFRETHEQVAWLAYATRVNRNEVHEFQDRMELEGFINFQIKPLADANESSAARYRLPISLLEPLEPSVARFLGGDVLSHPAWEPTVSRAIRSGRAGAVLTRGLLDGRPGVLLMRATYRGTVEPSDELSRLRQLAGLILIFIDTDSLLRISAGTRQDLSVRFLLDVHRQPGEVVTSLLASSDDGAFELDPVSSIALPIQVADLTRELLISMPLRPRLTGVFAAMAIALLPVITIILAIRSRRAAQDTQRKAFRQARLAEATLRSIDDAVIRVDQDGGVRYLNAMARQLSGQVMQPDRPHPIGELLPLRDKDGRLADWETLKRMLRMRQPLILNDDDGRSLVLSGTLSPVVGEHSGAEGFVLGLRDVTREHELAKELQHQASHDPLTELPNRRAFELQLQALVDDARESGSAHTLLYVDLDQFKLVNDTCGHAAGDQMLRQLAGLLAAECRTRDVLARLGGDEFGVLLRDCAIDQATPIAQRICDTVTEFRFTWDGRAFELGASIGVVEISARSGTADELQRSADLACYAAKDMGRNRFHVYRPEDQVIARNESDMKWQSEIKFAIEERRLILHAQPIVALGASASPKRLNEVLLRMRGPDGELIPPRAFIPAAERYGLMRQLDREVVRLAFEYLSANDDDGVVTSINLSGQTVTDPELEAYLVRISNEYAVDPTRVCFEITETSAISNLNLAVKLMNRLRERGFSFALDDFGAGLSSLSYLKQLPIDFLKIDGQFVRDLDSDAVARSMVSSIVSVADVLGIHCIAEMVEDTRSESRLRELGVDYAQGNHFGRSQPLVNVLVEIKSA